MTINLTIEREVGEDTVELEVECEFTCHKAYRGARDSCGGIRGAGPPLEPDEPAHCEFDSATGPDGKEIELTDREIERATEKANEALNDQGDE